MMVTKRCLPQDLIASGDMVDLSRAAFALEQVSLDRMGITVLDGLECFNQLLELYLDFNEIQKIQGLDFCPLLEVLSLSHNKIQKIENLRQLSNLKKLNLKANRIQEIDCAELPISLTAITLVSNPCKTYTQAVKKGLPSLEILDGRTIRGPQESRQMSVESKQQEEGDNDEDDEFDEGTWGKLFQENEKQTKAYLRKKEEEALERSSQDPNPSASVAIIDREELGRVWKAHDQAELKVYLEQVLGQAAREVTGEAEGFVSAKDEALRRLKEMRIKHDLESRRLVARVIQSLSNTPPKVPE
ncbi:hypothetical protein AAMO2058_001051900 [Amorphochlora amoebiformis]